MVYRLSYCPTAHRRETVAFFADVPAAIDAIPAHIIEASEPDDFGAVDVFNSRGDIYAIEPVEG